MIKIYNKFCGGIILLISKAFLAFSKTLNTKLIHIKKEITECNFKNKKLIPNELKNLIILIEDQRFYYHSGVDFYSILRAIYKIIFFNKIEGASTISQQLIRTIINEREISITRKLQEIFLSILLNKYFSQDELFNAYFHLYPINNTIGIHNFCERLKMDITKLSVYESCEIVARIKYPIITVKNENRYKQRIRIIQKNIYQ